jgi:TonB family protein
MWSGFQSRLAGLAVVILPWALGATYAGAQESPATEPIRIPASWERPPEADFPQSALLANITEGKVTVHCDVVPDGRLERCTVVSASPADAGFEAAALAAMPQSRVSRAYAETAGPDASVQFEVRFRLDPAQLASLFPASSGSEAGVNPRWDRKPEPAFPAGAVAAGVEYGAVTLMCAVTPQGLPQDCLVVEEMPQGFGFADSALAAMRSVTLYPRTVDGQEVSSAIRFTLRFRLAPEQAAPAPTE